jgi:hypothetical protein
MKFIKGYNLFESKSEIDEICGKYDITNYTINSDGSVDVDGDVYLSDENLTKLPLKFGEVSDIFFCENNKLTSLEGSPSSVGGSFLCHKNKLRTLDGAPQSVGRDFYCGNNELRTLSGSPKSVRSFYCQHNKLKTLVGGPRSVNVDFSCSNNQLTTIEGIPDIFGVIIYHSNPIYTVCSEWLINYGKPNMDKVELFNDFDIIVDNNLYWSKLEYFHEEIGKPLPDRSKIDKYYQIID